eukprot:4648209-Prymnesium_polylepis.2
MRRTAAPPPDESTTDQARVRSKADPRGLPSVEARCRAAAIREQQCGRCAFLQIRPGRHGCGGTAARDLSSDRGAGVSSAARRPGASRVLCARVVLLGRRALHSRFASIRSVCRARCWGWEAATGRARPKGWRSAAGLANRWP